MEMQSARRNFGHMLAGDCRDCVDRPDGSGTPDDLREGGVLGVRYYSESRQIVYCLTNYPDWLLQITIHIPHMRRNHSLSLIGGPRVIGAMFQKWPDADKRQALIGKLEPLPAGIVALVEDEFDGMAEERRDKAVAEGEASYYEAVMREGA